MDVTLESKELTLEQVAQQCGRMSEVALISSINFEFRSLGLVRRWCQIKPSVRTQAILAFLHAKALRVEPLEAIKSANYELAQFILQKAKIAGRKLDIRYPDGFSPATVISDLEEHLHGCPNAEAILLDITAIPTRVLLPLLDVVASIKKATPERRIFLLYTWSEKYPQASSVTQVGAVRRVIKDMSLDRSVQGNKHGRCIVVIGRQGFDALQVMESLHGDFDRHIIQMVNRDDVEHSFQVLAANRSIFTEGKISLDYATTIQRGAALMRELTESAARDAKGMVFIANFGPKPLTAAAYFRVEALKRGNRDTAGVDADLLTLSSHYYGSVYSVGAGPTTAYEI